MEVGRERFLFLQAEDGIQDIGVTGSSDVCSSDLPSQAQGGTRDEACGEPLDGAWREPASGGGRGALCRRIGPAGPRRGREGGASGKGVDLRGLRVIKNTKTQIDHTTYCRHTSDAT